MQNQLSNKQKARIRKNVRKMGWRNSTTNQINVAFHPHGGSVSDGKDYDDPILEFNSWNEAKKMAVKIYCDSHKTNIPHYPNAVEGSIYDY